MIFWKFLWILKYHSPKNTWIAIEYYDYWLFIFGLARLTRIFNPSTDSETSVKVMRYWKFSQKTKLKQKIFTDREKEARNFFKTGIIVFTACLLIPALRIDQSDLSWLRELMILKFWEPPCKFLVIPNCKQRKSFDVQRRQRHCRWYTVVFML